jgi:hypothetical protein
MKRMQEQATYGFLTARSGREDFDLAGILQSSEIAHLAPAIDQAFSIAS